MSGMTVMRTAMDLDPGTILKLSDGTYRLVGQRVDRWHVELLAPPWYKCLWWWVGDRLHTEER